MPDQNSTEKERQDNNISFMLGRDQWQSTRVVGRLPHPCAVSSSVLFYNLHRVLLSNGLLDRRLINVHGEGGGLGGEIGVP